MNIIIYDTEYTSWQGSLENNWSREDEYRELVQLSAIKIKINQNNISIIDKFSEYCIPNINSNLSKYFTELTGITNDTINKLGVNFNKLIENFYNFSKDYKCFCYGSKLGNDSHILIENMDLNKNKNENILNWIHKNHFDIRPLFQSVIDTQNYNSGNLYKAFNLKIDTDIVKEHNSLWDVKSQFYCLQYLYHNNKDILLNYLKI
tara:strand:- start:42 stop:656 length:615 start_codon:yes stop_codon:yes gene_type:complete